MKVLLLGFCNSIPELVTATYTITNKDTNKDLELYAVSLNGETTECINLPLKTLYKFKILPDITFLGKYLANIISDIGINLVLADSFQYSKYLAAVIAEKLGIPILSNVIRIERISETELIVECSTALMKLNVIYRITIPAVLIIQGGIFEKHSTDSECKVIELTPTLESSIRIRRYEKRALGEFTKDVIIGIGRGVSKESLELVKKLGEMLNARIVCSRPLAVEMGICREWVGLSGMKIAPRVYIALGISGQQQHLVGIRSSKTIIAINNDENAPIFSNCDYGFVAAIEDLLPIVIDVLKSLKHDTKS